MPKASMDSFPFDSLPGEIQSRILVLLPITTLVLCKAVSPSWRSIIRSPSFTASYRPSRDPIFLLYCYMCPTTAACAYLPSTDSWIYFHFPQPLSIHPTTGTSLLLAEFGEDCRYIVNPFSPPHPIHFLPWVPHAHIRFEFLALIEHSASDYIIVVVSPTDGGTLHSRTYHSRSGRWKERGHIWLGVGFINVGNAVYLDGLLFCFCSPNRFLTFDPVGGQWTMLELDLPIPLFHHHLLGFGGELYLTAAFREDMNTRVGIWELDRSALAWKEVDFMPNNYLSEFSETGLSFLSMTDCRGVICFSTVDPKEIVLCDLAARRWWRPRPCNISRERGFSIKSVIEPHINLLK